MLDEQFGWCGCCVDPNANRMASRTCAFFPVALASRTGTAQFSWGGPYSGLTEFVSSETHNAMHCDMAEHMWTSTVEVRTPLEVLESAHAPTEIDYLSLDVEGSEMEILRAFPFDKYRIAFATIETNNDAAKEVEMRDFMCERGYAFIGHAGNDDYFACEPARRNLRYVPPLDYYERTEHTDKRSRRRNV